MSSQEANYEEIAQRGEALYEQMLRDSVEVETNIGKMISLDVETGEYEIGDDPLITGKRLLARLPDATLYGKRIGYNAVYALGGALVRTAK